MVKEWLQKVPDLDGVIVGGGSPCQGLSVLSADRKHLLDPRSALFHDAAKVTQMVEAEAKREDMWCLKFLENVVADEADIRAMSNELEMRPVLVDSEGISRAKRPRLFWLSTQLILHEEVEVRESCEYDVVSYTGETEDLRYILDEGWSWKKGDEDPLCRFPTFTRAIPRAAPPKAPAGLSHTPEEAQKRWKAHQHRYPPYTYKDEYVVEDQDQNKRVLNANERELLMGFPRGHTLALAKKIPEKVEEQQSLEDLRCSALGNSFHAVAVACLFDHALWSLGVKALKGHRAILKEVEKERQTSYRQGMVWGSTTPMSEGSQGGKELGEEGPSEEEGMFLEEFKAHRGLSDLTKLDGVAKSDVQLATMMVGAFLRRQEYRGSDVRLDVGTLYRPDACPRATVNPHRWKWHTAHHYPFQREEHINILEMRAYIHCMEWRLRNAGFQDARALHLLDSQVVISVSTKGRSSSRQLNRLLRKLGAMTLAAGIYPILAWIESHLNPADGPSRYYER
eukprot:Skav226690  [mRNA]  locus=scaffold3971:127988:129514:- [translate_table: standard]